MCTDLDFTIKKTTLMDIDLDLTLKKTTLMCIDLDFNLCVRSPTGMLYAVSICKTSLSRTCKDEKKNRCNIKEE